MSDFIQTINDDRRIKKIVSAFCADTAFNLCLGSTETSDVVGISAAGSTPEARRLTPAADAEALVTGRTVSLDKLPVSPVGVVSPVVITRACLQLVGITPKVIDCGSFFAPQIAHDSLGCRPAATISEGEAMPLDMVQLLFQKGFQSGEEQSSRHPSIIIAECVPGGTTTALGLLLGLGYDARASLSSSIPNCNHKMRLDLVEQGLKSASAQRTLSSPFEILAAVGDPMQPFVAGMALSACRRASVVLAGGSQMLAVYALIKALAPTYKVDLTSAEVGVITTKWVAFDPHARIADVCREVGAPMVASCPDFALSRHQGLRAYEEGNVKEGVGAGAALALAYTVSGCDGDTLMEAIDQSYDEMVGQLCSSSFT